MGGRFHLIASCAFRRSRTISQLIIEAARRTLVERDLEEHDKYRGFDGRDTDENQPSDQRR
jgi:hypothetical protein